MCGLVVLGWLGDTHRESRVRGRRQRQMCIRDGSRPSDGELVGGLDEQQSVFVAPWATFAAAGATSPDKFDNVTDPGPAALVDEVGEVLGGSLIKLKLCGTDATGPVSFAVGAKWTAYNVTAAAWQSGTVLAINPGGDGTVQLSSAVAGLLNQQIMIYPAQSRVF